MSDSAPAPAGPGACAARKRTCGWLWLSLFATFSVYLLLMGKEQRDAFIVIYPWLGIPPAVGLFFGIVGYRAVKRDPNLTGPTFAWACMILAVLSIAFQVNWRIQFADAVEWSKAFGETNYRFADALKKKDGKALFEALAPSYQASHSPADVEALLEKVFPGAGPLDLKKETSEDSEEEQRAVFELLNSFAKGKTKTIDFRIRSSISDRRGRVRLERRFHAWRDEKGRIKVEIRDFGLERVVEPAKPAKAGEAGSGEAPGRPGKAETPASPEKPGGAGEPEKPDRPKDSG